MLFDANGILGMPIVIEASFCINLEVSFSEYPVSMLEVGIVEEYLCQEKWNTGAHSVFP